jgi:hypothetical protein
MALTQYRLRMLHWIRMSDVNEKMETTGMPFIRALAG